MNALASRLAKLEQNTIGNAFGRFILLGGAPHPDDTAVAVFLRAKGVERTATDMVLTGMDETPAAPGVDLTLLGIVPCDQSHELALMHL